MWAQEVPPAAYAVRVLTFLISLVLCSARTALSARPAERWGRTPSKHPEHKAQTISFRRYLPCSPFKRGYEQGVTWIIKQRSQTYDAL